MERGKRFLNSGLFIGYAPEINEILNSAEIKNDDDDQLFYTKVYLDDKKRKELNIKLDHRSELFQNLNGAVSDVELLLLGIFLFYAFFVLMFEKSPFNNYLTCIIRKRNSLAQHRIQHYPSSHSC